MSKKIISLFLCFIILANFVAPCFADKIKEVKIVTEPGGANIYLDGKFIRKSPTKVNLKIRTWKERTLDSKEFVRSTFIGTIVAAVGYLFLLMIIYPDGADTVAEPMWYGFIGAPICGLAFGNKAAEGFEKRSAGIDYNIQVRKNDYKTVIKKINSKTVSKSLFFQLKMTEEAIQERKRREKEEKERIERNYSKHFKAGKSYLSKGGVENYERAIDEFNKALKYKKAKEAQNKLKEAQEKYKRSLRR